MRAVGSGRGLGRRREVEGWRESMHGCVCGSYGFVCIMIVGSEGCDLRSQLGSILCWRGARWWLGLGIGGGIRTWVTSVTIKHHLLESRASRARREKEMIGRRDASLLLYTAFTRLPSGGDGHR